MTAPLPSVAPVLPSVEPPLPSVADAAPRPSVDDDAAAGALLGRDVPSFIAAEVVDAAAAADGIDRSVCPDRPDRVDGSVRDRVTPIGDPSPLTGASATGERSFDDRLASVFTSVRAITIITITTRTNKH